MDSTLSFKQCTKIAKKIRYHILTMGYEAQSAHIGGALSCVEILVTLYYLILKIDPHHPLASERDRLLFSKAHDVKALYAVLAEKGYFSLDKLHTYEQDAGLPGHSTRFSPTGIDYSLGSLGHGLPIACGVALACKEKHLPSRVYAILSDGECEEGSTWEAMLFAHHHKLDNLIVIVDYNRLQAMGTVDDIMSLHPLDKKWQAAGWNVKKIDGHSIPKLYRCFTTIARTPTANPTVVIANTIKGKGGVKQHINQVSSQYAAPTAKEWEDVATTYQS